MGRRAGKRPVRGEQRWRQAGNSDLPPGNRKPAGEPGDRTQPPRPRTAPAELKPSAAGQPASAADTGSASTADQLARGALRWTRLGVLVALVSVVAAFAAVDDLRSYTFDWVQDRRGVPPMQVDVRVSETTHGLYWASGAVLNVRPEAVLAEIQRQGGALVGYSRQELTLESRRDATLYLTDIEPIDIERRPPLAGTLFGISPQGQVENSEVRLRLDTARPVLLDQDNGQPFFAGKHINLDRGEVHVVNVQSEALQCYCTWRLRITYRYRGSTRTIVVPPVGRDPFRMTAFLPPQNYGAQYVPNVSWQLERIDCVAAKSACARTGVPKLPVH